MNRVEYTGRLTTDGDLTFSASGTAFYKNTIAVDRRYKKEGEPDADFFKFKMFGNAAETFQKWTEKGSKVFIAGHNQNNNYTDKEGTKHYEIVLVVDEFEFLDRKSDTKEDTIRVPDDVELPFN